VKVVASLSQGRTAAAQCGLFTHKSVPVIFEPPCKIAFILFYFKRTVIILPRSSIQSQEFLWLALLTTEGCGSEGSSPFDQSEVFVLCTSIERVNILKHILTYLITYLLNLVTYLLTSTLYFCFNQKLYKILT